MYIMPDYTKAVIYKIETGGELYVGSTCNFTQRKYQHNSAVNFKEYCHCTAKLYNTIRENGEWRMTPIKEFPCESKLQLTIEEEKCRKELGATLNTHCCGTGIDCQDEKQYSKQHYEQKLKSEAVS
jgi:predicted GIY-YIG superfamily endonuclease